MNKMFNIEKSNNLVKDSEFMMALRCGDPLSENTINNLNKFITPTIRDFDEHVDEIWDFKYHSGIGEPMRMIVQHLRKPDIYMTFTSIDNIKYAPYFNKCLKNTLDYFELISYRF